MDKYISRALNVEMEDGRIPIFDDSAYVLTLDYAIKMLNINERFKCGVPVIIEGETGVGKTALVEMLSKLWNQSLLLQWRKERSAIIESLLEKLKEYEDVPKASQGISYMFSVEEISYVAKVVHGQNVSFRIGS